jgi:hypothetical protein
MFAIARVGDRPIAAGGALWSSDDGGMSWTKLMDGASIGGTAYAVDAFGDLVVAVGDGGNGDVTGPPALAMISTDGGDSWERYVIDPDAGATAVAIGAEGRITVAGHLDNQLVTFVSADLGGSWSTTVLEGLCCAADLVATPTGYVLAADGALMSPDGIAWAEHPLETGVLALSWGPHFGLVAATESSILLGPVPAP